MSKEKKWMINPDVSCRVEDEDGAILFNPDNDATQVINPIGLDIWRSLEGEFKSLREVIVIIKGIYEDVPNKQVEKDVEKFIMDLSQRGFIGEMLNEQER